MKSLKALYDQCFCDAYNEYEDAPTAIRMARINFYEIAKSRTAEALVSPHLDIRLFGKAAMEEDNDY